MEEENKFKRIINNLKDKIIEHKIFTVVNALVLILVIFLFTRKWLYGLISLIIWLIVLIVLLKIGGNDMIKKKKKSSISESSSKDVKKKRRKKHRLLKLFLNLFLLGTLVGLIGGIIFAIYIVINAPDFNPDNLYRAESTIIYDKDGNQIAKIGVEKRKKIDYDDLPQVLVDAIIATEDSRYYQHNGFDLPRFTKAAFGQVINKITGHGNAGGGSTISMQVVKNNFTTVDQTITRKFTDIYISIFKLEKNYSKEEILEYYVNTPFLGNGSYGVEQACQSYFGKSVSDINLAEASIIAGLFQAPSAYDPYMYPEDAEARREVVLYLMKLHGYITEEEEKLANSIPVKSLLRSSNSEVATNEFQSFIDIVLDEVEEKTGNNPYTTGMKIYTTLDPGKQRVLNDVMAGKTVEWKDDLIQAGIGVVDTNTGAILAIGGGRHREGERQYNFATMINKQIGSTAKPLFDYGPAIEYNNFCESTPFYDAPYTYSNGVSIKNWDGGYQGVITLKSALAASRNIPALKAFQSVDNAKIKEFVTSLGMTPEIDEEGVLHEAHSLGGFNGTNPVQLAGAYAAFGNGGFFTKPYSVNKVEYIDNGKTVSLKGRKKRVMSDATAYMITDILMYAVDSEWILNGDVDGVALAAKTGTTNLTSEIQELYNLPSNAVNDVWSVGYTPEFSIAIWYGYDKLVEGYYNTGGYEKNMIFLQVIDAISNRDAKQSFDVPSSVVKVTVEKETYPVLLPSDNTPDDMKVTEYCKAGTEPTTVSQRFKKISDVSNLKETENGDKITLTWSSVAEPEYYTLDNFKKLNNVLYAQHIDEKWAEMQSGNGSFGYLIIERDLSTGESYEKEFTTGTSYSFTRPEHDSVYTVIARYRNSSVTASGGIDVEVKGSNPVIDVESFTATNSNSSVSVKMKDTNATLANVTNGIKVLNDKGKDITENCTIIAISPCTTNSGDGQCSISSNLATFSAPGTYTIEFEITYKGEAIEVDPTVVTVTE
ncbi:MAG: transglycosylase domain-containing protein [Bacilli bacterium]|nr:transglycosylase domain-containing protein [Bacilli bacterium]